MFFLVIVVMAAVAVGALLRQQQSKQHKPEEGNSAGESSDGATTNPENPANSSEADAASATSGAEGTGTDAQGTADHEAGGLPKIQEDAADYAPVLSVKPISSPEALSGATYSSAAPASSGSDSPYGYGNKTDQDKKAKTPKTLLRWCGRTGSLQVDSFLILGPITYWSEGQSGVPEPSCIDTSLPVDYPAEGTPLPPEGPASYSEMSSVQRGLYLTWLAGGRIQPPLFACFPTLWLYGLERRVIADRLDLGLCFSEAFRLLPLVRWEPFLDNLIKFLTWLAIKIWMPEDELLAFCRKLQTVPESLLVLLLGPYANAKLPLPAGTAFTLMRTSAKLREKALGPELASQRMVHSNELQQKFATMYRNACSGGLKLEKPTAVTKLSYMPTNPSLATQNKGKPEVVEIPDFFSNLSVFEPLLIVWRDFVSGLAPQKQGTASEQVEGRPDFEAFIEKIQAGNKDVPLISNLADVADFLGLDRTTDAKLRGRDRKTIVETVRVEGYQILPNLGLSGRDYLWDEKILFLRIDLGEKFSLDYNVASFLLEFCCALMEIRDERLFEPLRQRLNDYFSLTTDDNLRLDEQRLINLPAPHPKEFYGDFLQFLLQEPERGLLRNFLLHLMDFIPESQITKAVLKERVCTALAIAADATPEMGEDGPAKRGDAVAKIFSPLFKEA